MKKDIFEQLKEFVIKQRWEYKFPLTRDTSLQKDLKIWGDDAVEFILDFSQEFGVDVSEFKIDKYFRPEGDIILPSFISFLQGKKRNLNH